MKKNLLVTLADKNYIDQAKALFSSVYFKAGWQGDYMLLAYDIPEENLRWFADKGILVKRCQPLFSDEFWYSSLPSGVLPPIVSIKYYLFTEEFKKWGNIVYLDGDIMVKASLDELEAIQGFGAIYDVGGQLLKNQFSKDNQQLFNKLNQEYNLKNSTFNAGVMAFSTDIIKPDTFIKLKELFKKYSAISIYSEQSILNLFFYKQYKPLLPIYNIYITDNRNQWFIKINKIKGIIFHFIGTSSDNQPWNESNYFYQEWKSNLDKVDHINLKEIPVGNKWTNKQIRNYSHYLSTRFFLLIPIAIIDRMIGKVGLFIKKYFPKLYFSIKNHFIAKSNIKKVL